MQITTDVILSKDDYYTLYGHSLGKHEFQVGSNNFPCLLIQFKEGFKNIGTLIITKNQIQELIGCKHEG
jgi:hypothetical protein